MPRQPLDALANLPEQRPCQVAFRELQGEVPSVPDQPPARLEQPLLETRGPVLERDWQHQPTQQVTEVVGDHAEEQPHLVGPKAVAGEPSPVGGGLALLDPLLRRPALIVEADDGPVNSGQGRDDEAHPREQLSEMMFDLRDHVARAVPGGGLVLEAAVADERGVTRSAARSRQQILDLALEYVIGGQPDRVAHPAAFQCLIDLGPGERGVRPDHDPLSRLRYRSMMGSKTSSHPSALWTLPGR